MLVANIDYRASIFRSFSGTGKGKTFVQLIPSPGGSSAHARVTIDDCTSHKIANLGLNFLPSAGYESNPCVFERSATRALATTVPELLNAINYALGAGVIAIEINGLPSQKIVQKTPPDGIVIERDVRRHVFNLTGCLTHGVNLCGFAYSNENGGRLLRGIVPVAEKAAEVSSQGFAGDLNWHQDNANRPIFGVRDSHPSGKGPMNAFQAFATVTPDVRTPMEIVALADVVNEAEHVFGTKIIRQLERPLFAIESPASHRKGLGVSGVPLLVRGHDGCIHGRIHAENVTGQTTEAQAAFDAFRAVLMNTTASIQVQSAPGALLLYCNTRVLHRRRRYTPSFDGHDRYYIRLYLTPMTAIQRFANQATGRVFD